ncbi:hypothetical protein BKA93DRAFT_365307 [Sparassis latifolia]
MFPCWSRVESVLKQLCVQSSSRRVLTSSVVDLRSTHLKTFTVDFIITVFTICAIPTVPHFFQQSKFVALHLCAVFCKSSLFWVSLGPCICILFPLYIEHAVASFLQVYALITRRIHCMIEQNISLRECKTEGTTTIRT